MGDEELVKLALEGDNEAFRHLHDRYIGKIFQYAYTQTGDYHQAEELAQDIMYKVASRLATFKGDSAFKTWLFTIGRRVVIDYHRSQKKHKHTVFMENDKVETFQEQSVSVEREVLQKEVNQQLMNGLNQLPIHYRMVLHLRFIEGFSISDTAEVMSKTTKSIKALQVRAKQQLSAILGNEVNENHE